MWVATDNHQHHLTSVAIRGSAAQLWRWLPRPSQAQHSQAHNKPCCRGACRQPAAEAAQQQVHSARARDAHWQRHPAHGLLQRGFKEPLCTGPGWMWVAAALCLAGKPAVLRLLLHERTFTHCQVLLQDWHKACVLCWINAVSSPRFALLLCGFLPDDALALPEQASVALPGHIWVVLLLNNWCSMLHINC